MVTTYAHAYDVCILLTCWYVQRVAYMPLWSWCTTRWWCMPHPIAKHSPAKQWSKCNSYSRIRLTHTRGYMSCMCMMTRYRHVYCTTTLMLNNHNTTDNMYIRYIPPFIYGICPAMQTTYPPHNTTIHGNVDVHVRCIKTTVPDVCVFR